MLMVLHLLTQLATSQGSGVISSVNGVNKYAVTNYINVRTEENGKLVFEWAYIAAIILFMLCSEGTTNKYFIP